HRRLLRGAVGVPLVVGIRLVVGDGDLVKHIEVCGWALDAFAGIGRGRHPGRSRLRPTERTPLDDGSRRGWDDAKWRIARRLPQPLQQRNHLFWIAAPERDRSHRTARIVPTGAAAAVFTELRE